jgi:endonuclease YncB( thermonuclease family)
MMGGLAELATGPVILDGENCDGEVWALAVVLKTSRQLHCTTGCMRHVAAIRFAFAMAVLAPQLWAAPLVRSSPVLVRKVPDGASIEVAGTGRVRLLGVRAPAIDRTSAGSSPLSVRSRQRLESLVLNRWVILEYEPTAQARSHAAYLFLETGVFVNELMVKEGLARVAGTHRLVRIKELERAQAEAQAARRGIWAAK